MKSLSKHVLAKIPFGFTVAYYTYWLISRFFIFKKYQENIALIAPRPGWILDRICKEIKAELKKGATILYGLGHIPRARVYFFSHYNMFVSTIIRKPHILLDRNYIYFTHYTPIDIPERDLGRILNLATKIFVMNSLEQERLVSFGVVKEKIEIVYAGVDDKEFYPLKKEETQGPLTVGLCLRYEDYENYAERKDYGHIVAVIKQLSSYNVLLLGKNWKSYDRFSELAVLPYFSYVETSYENYPKYYNQMDIFLSLSRLEGGPVPLLESMFCGVFPVVTNTGFARDIINHGTNGLLFDIDAEIPTILARIKDAESLLNTVLVHDSVAEFTWSNFGKAISKELERGSVTSPTKK